jgi:O-antigen ligase
MFTGRYSLALLYTIVIVGFPLFSSVPLLLGAEGAERAQLSIAYRALCLVLVGFVVLRWFASRVRIFAGSAMLAVFLLWWILLARLSWDGIFQSDSLDVDFVRYSLFLVGVCIIPALAFLEIPSERVLRVARVQIEVLGSLAALFIMYLYLTDVLASGIITRLSTEILNPISVGQLGVSLFIVSVAAMQDGLGPHRGVAGTSSKVLRICVALGALVIVLASGSRGPILCAFIVAAIMALVPLAAGEQRRSKVFVRAVTMAAAAGAAVAVAFYLERETSFGMVSRMVGGFDDEASLVRIQLTAGALSQFMAHPIVGDAIVERVSAYYPHNIFIESLMATGLVGFVLLSMVVAVCTRAAWRLIRASHATRWVGLLYVQSFVVSLFSGSLFLDGQFWALSVAVLAISSAVRYGRVAGVPRIGRLLSTGSQPGTNLMNAPRV